MRGGTKPVVSLTLDHRLQAGMPPASHSDATIWVYIRKMGLRVRIRCSEQIAAHVACSPDSERAKAALCRGCLRPNPARKTISWVCPWSGRVMARACHGAGLHWSGFVTERLVNGAGCLRMPPASHSDTPILFRVFAKGFCANGYTPPPTNVRFPRSATARLHFPDPMRTQPPSSSGQGPTLQATAFPRSCPFFAHTTHRKPRGTIF